jgi:outer membrane protein TolC
MNTIAMRCFCVLFFALLLSSPTQAFQIAHQLPQMFSSDSTPVPLEPQSGRRPVPIAPAAPTSSPNGILTLEEVLQRVEQFHPKMLGAQTERDVATGKRLEKQGAFDPVVNIGTDYLRYNSASRRGSLLNTRTNDVSVEFLTRSGIKVFAGSSFNFGTVKSPLSSTGETGTHFVGLKVPLWRNFRINEKSAAERQAFLGEPLAEEQIKLTRLDLQLKAALSYWEWVAAKQKLDVARNLLELSKIRAEAVQTRVKAGDLPPIDAVEANQEVQRRQGGLTKAERDLQKAAFKLSLYLWEPNGLPSPLPAADNVPVNFARPTVFTNQQAVEAQRLALERRPELRVLALNQDISQIDLELGRNQRRPALELGLSPGRDTGFGGVGNIFKAELSLSLPLRQRTADGRIQTAQAKLQKLDLDILNQRQTITVEVNDAVNAINTTYERFLAAESEVQLARQLEVGERTRFNLGDSTLFLVNQRERATAEAENKLIEIRAEYEQAVAAFRAASGSFR